MILIGENIHIISKSVREAIENRNENFIKSLLVAQKNMDCIDLNVGPARKGSIFEWLVPFVKENSDLKISFDTTNPDEMKRGLELFNNCENCFINSASKDDERFDKMTDLALEYGCNLILLTLDKETGIPKTADGRLEIAFELYEKSIAKGLESEKLFFDPLVLPLSVDQSQAMEAINTIRMIKESFDPPVKTVVGLSNVSNGSPKELRPLINRVFACFAFGAGLDAAIIDAKDIELVRILKMLELDLPENEIDKLYIQIANTVRDFGEFSEITYDVADEEQQKIMKTVGIICGEKIYSHSFTQV
ncbi:MAG: methyltetrahydrofolate--corrinoid methyltransferase [Cyanobacteria bacterium SIG32]|nr:methyltetrahydrofolate--corrinoid methyltransferase [Cyanobacteria bacterium SIG32]